MKRHIMNNNPAACFFIAKLCGFGWGIFISILIKLWMTKHVKSRISYFLVYCWNLTMHEKILLSWHLIITETIFPGTGSQLGIWKFRWGCGGGGGAEKETVRRWDERSQEWGVPGQESCQVSDDTKNSQSPKCWFLQKPNHTTPSSMH